jgi:hypothetical protein
MFSKLTGVTAAIAVGASVTGAGAGDDRLVPSQFSSIQSAVNASSNGDRVLVAAGTYHEQVNLNGKEIQLIGIEGAATTFIDGDDVHTVIVGQGEPAGCIVRGFTIQHGRDGGYSNGGGVSLRGSSAKFESCRFVENTAEAPAWWGGGAWRSEYGDPVIQDCHFYNNDGAGSTAGIYHYLGGSIHISGCVFDDNTSEGGQQIHIQTEGGSIAATIDRCQFRRNIGRGGDNFTIGFWNPYGGTILCTITDCVVQNPIISGVPNGPNSLAAVALGAYPQSSYNVVIERTTACGVPIFVVTDSNSTWTDGGGNRIDPLCITDCNSNGYPDDSDIANGTSADQDTNGIPDECEFVDCNQDGIADSEQVASGQLPDYDGNNIPDCCDRGEACVIGSYPVQWRTADGGNGHWYILQRNGSYLCWSTANAFAQSGGGYLVSETTEAEHSFVSGRLVARDDAWSGRWGPWIGGLYTGGSWTWTSGEPWSFTAWHPGEPNGGGSETVVSYISPGGAGDCGRTTMWNDWLDCATVQASGCEVGVWNYIIEWSADCNNDGTVDYGQILRGELPDINHNGTPDTCECIGDIYVDRAINGADLGALLAYWGPVTSNAASRACDLNGDGVVSGSDLGVLLAYWGPCSN